MNKVIKLSFIDMLEINLSQNNGLIQVLIGPRQVGKTTTVLHFFKAHFKDQFLYESADEVFNSTAQWLSELWGRAIHQNKILVIDEIQKCESWAAVIKKLSDASKKEKLKVRCVLLGSSSLEIQKGLTESLTGRFQLIKAFHWNFRESNEGYRLTFKDYLKYGGYPAPYQFKDRTEWVNYVKNSIVSTVIEKDILQFQKVKSPSLFKQAFEILVSYPAQEISYTKILGQIQDKGNVDLVKYYIALFEGAFLMKALEKYSEKKFKTKSSSPKILLLAPCLYYLNILDDYRPEELGRVFELLVGAQLNRTDQSLYYWREGGDEVDYVLKEGRRIYAIEVKSGRKKSSKGLLKFKEKFGNSKSVTINLENYFEFEKDPLGFLRQHAY